MEPIGMIVAESSTKPILSERWVEILREHPNLVSPGLREGINPFTKKPMTIFPRMGVSTVVIDGREVGRLKWRGAGENTILVFGEPSSVGPLAREIAQLLGGRFEEGTPALGPAYWRVVDPVWRSISIYDGPDVFLDQFRAVPIGVGHLFAAHWCQSEVCNGGFRQFFSNRTGVLAPEAVIGFRAIGLEDWATVLNEAMQFFGEPYPRDRGLRSAKLAEVPIGDRGEGNPFRPFDDRFYSSLRDEPKRFDKAADEYAQSLAV